MWHPIESRKLETQWPAVSSEPQANSVEGLQAIICGIAKGDSRVVRYVCDRRGRL